MYVRKNDNNNNTTTTTYNNNNTTTTTTTTTTKTTTTRIEQKFWVDTRRRVGGFCGIRQLCEQFPTHLNEVCLQGFAALVNSARDVPRTFSGGLMRWVPVKMTVTLVSELFEELYKHS